MNVLAIIQARMDSNRLPGKALMLLENKPILEHIIDSLRFSNFINKIIIATTNLSEDDVIYDLAKNLGVEVFRGDPNDVLSRFYKCAKLYDGEIVLRLTGDNPLVDPELIDQIIDISKTEKCDYVSNVLHLTFPYGYSPCEAINFKTLEYLYKNKTDPKTREHIVYYIKRNPELFNLKEVTAPKNLERPDWRLTIDYIEDYQLLSKIFSKLYVQDSYIQYKILVDFLDNHPNLKEINKKYH